VAVGAAALVGWGNDSGDGVGEGRLSEDQLSTKSAEIAFADGGNLRGIGSIKVQCSPGEVKFTSGGVTSSCRIVCVSNSFCKINRVRCNLNIDRLNNRFAAM